VDGRDQDALSFTAPHDRPHAVVATIRNEEIHA
jgi:hypothetical protein